MTVVSHDGGEGSHDDAQTVEYYQVRSKKGKATIHKGMSKDSVIILLGKPSQFISDDYVDEITYTYGPHDLNSLNIGFRNGKVYSVRQTEL